MTLRTLEMRFTIQGDFETTAESFFQLEDVGSQAANHR